MKIRNLLSLSVLLLGAQVSAQTAGDYIDTGRALLPGNLAGAYANFSAALGLSPTNETANALAAVTRILMLPQQPAGSNFLNRLGLPNAGRDIFNWTATFPVDANGRAVFPATLDSTDGITLYSNAVMPAVEASLSNLAMITHQDFTLTLTAGETGIDSVTVDRGDILLLQAMLHSAEFAGHTLDAHNFSVVIKHLQNLQIQDNLSIQQVLADYPNLLKSASKSELAASRTALTNAIASYLSASDFIRNVRQPGDVRLFNLSAHDISEEAAFRDVLSKVPDSLNQPVNFDTNASFSIYAGAYFNGSNSLRSLLPQFNANYYVSHSLPDYTFGGILVDVPACDVEALLQKKFEFSLAGIYRAQLYDFNYDQVGDVAVIVQTNKQAAVLGYDFNDPSSVYETFTVNKDGSWQFDANGFGGWGSIDHSGEVQGSVYPDDGSWWDSFYGEVQSNVGPFLSSAGLYAGTWSGQGQSGPLYAVLTADGQILYSTLKTATAPGTGGEGQLDSTNHFISSTGGTTVEGVLHPTDLQIKGTFSSVQLTGTWTINRTATVTSDTPPAIVSAPQSTNALSGDTVQFIVKASGSPPLCYQWFSNSVPLAKATSSNLVLTAVQVADSITYSVVVRNVAGQDTASATLKVSPGPVLDKTPPALDITSAADLQLVAAKSITLAGTASDSGNGDNGIAFVKVNGARATNDTASADGTASWGLRIALASGTNRIVVIASDGQNNTTTNILRLISDTTGPALTVTAPKTGQHLSNSWCVVTANASDASGVSNVWCQISTSPGAWASMGQTSSNWTTGLVLSPGTNTIKVYAEDNAGNKSDIISLNLTFVQSDRLIVSRTGLGTITPNYSNAVLEIGKSYTMTAKAADSYVFSNWTGGVTPATSILTNRSTLKFTMQSNLVLAANFVLNPFTAGAGNYAGLFYDTNNGVTVSNAGLFTAKVAGNGSFTAKLRQGVNSYPFSGQFSLSGGWGTNDLKGTPGWNIWLSMDLAGGDEITGVVSNSDWTSDLAANRASYSNAHPAPQVGKYTLIIPGTVGSTNLPGGSGVGTVTVSAPGTVTFTGTLGDGSPVTETTFVSKEGQWPLYVLLYSKQGLILGWMTFTNDAATTNDLEGIVNWIKPGPTASKLYPSGFQFALTNGLETMGSLWTNGTPLLNWTNGLVLFQNGNLPLNVTNEIALSTAGIVTDDVLTNKLKMTINHASGTFKGTFADPVTKATRTFKGALLQHQNVGYGLILGTNQSSSVFFGPNE